MNSDTQVLRIRDVGAVRVFSIATGPKVNPLTNALQSQLLAALGDVQRNPAVRAVVLTGAGKTFCVGADLSAMGQAGAPGAADSVGNQTADAMETLTNRVVLSLTRLPMPVVCALNGVATGAGVGLALAGDIIVGARSAWLQLPFMNRLGIVPDMGASWFLQRGLGTRRAAALSLLGDRLEAQTAVDWGLLWACWDDECFEQEVLALATRLAALPAHAAQSVRALYRSAAQHTLPEQLDYETRTQRQLLDGAAFAEGVRAFFERREPVFPPRAER